MNTVEHIETSSFCGRAALTVSEAPGEAGIRLDKWLAFRLPGLSRSRLKELIEAGQVSRNARPALDPGQKVKAGEVYEVDVPEPVPAEPVGEDIALSVVYEDAHLLVIDKPAGLVVHPAAGHQSGTLVNALIAHCGESLSGIGGVRRPGIVHRLDKDTSGLLVVAKTDAAHHGLSEQFASHGLDGRLHRAYQALVWNAPERGSGRIEAPLGRSTSNRVKMAVVPASAGRHAVTHYHVERVLPSVKAPLAALVRCELETGRTHQIRVHMAHIGHPLMGDAVYATGFATKAVKLPPAAQAALAALGRQALHAAELGFEHPVTRKKMSFVSELPPDLGALLAALCQV